MTRKTTLAGITIATISCMLPTTSWGAQSSHCQGKIGGLNRTVCTTAGNGNAIFCKSTLAGFSEALGNQLLQLMPDKKKAVLLQTADGNVDQSIGRQVQRYLAKHGYKIRRVPIAVMGSPQVYPFTSQGIPYQLTITPC